MEVSSAASQSARFRLVTVGNTSVINNISNGTVLFKSVSRDSLTLRILAF